MKEQALYQAAHEAGLEAAAKCVPVPMAVSVHADPLNDQSPVIRQYAPVMAGVCGFAWVDIKPASSKFAKYLLSHGIARKGGGYGGPGICVRVREFNQSLELKSAYADAFAAVLRTAGIKASSDSRMD